MWPGADLEEEGAVWEISKHLSKCLSGVLDSRVRPITVVIIGKKKNNRLKLKQQRVQFFLIYERMGT